MCLEVRVFLESEVHVHGFVCARGNLNEKRNQKHRFTLAGVGINSQRHTCSLHFTCSNLFTQFSLCATFIRFQKGSFRLLYNTKEKKTLFSNGHVDVQVFPDMKQSPAEGNVSLYYNELFNVC